MKKIILIIAFIGTTLVANAQVGIGNTDPQATLDVTGVTTAGVPDGVIVPRFTRLQLTAKSGAYSAANQLGALVFVTAATGATDAKTATVTAVGFYYYAANDTWVCLGCSSAPAVSVVTITTTPYLASGTEDIILANVASASLVTLPATATVGKRIVISNRAGSGGAVSIAVAGGGSFWNSNALVAVANSNIFTYTASGWILEAVGLN